MGLSENMSKFWTIMMLVIFLLFAAGTIALMTMSIPSPSEKVERELDDDKFPR